MLYRFAGFVLDSVRFALTTDSGEAIALQPRALELLILLVSEAGRMVPKETIMREVWGGSQVSRSTLPTQVKAIRRALGDDPKPHRLIDTVHGRGLRFIGNVQAERAQSPAVPLAPDLAGPQEREGVASSLIGSQPTIAVLPFAQDPHIPLQYQLGRSLAVDILTALSRQRFLRVTARASSFLLDGPNVSPLAVKTTLGADYCLSGQVYLVADRYQVSVELADTASQHIVWAGQFELDIAEIQVTHEMIVAQIVNQIERQVPRYEAQSLRFAQPESLTAWQSFHMGESLVLRRGEANFLRARQYFQRSVLIDPGFARAWSGLAHTHAFEVVHRDVDQSREALQKMRATVEKALSADPDDSSANMMMGRAMALSRANEPSEPWFMKALDLSPSYAEAHHQIGLALAFVDDLERASNHSSASILLSPQGSERYGGYANLAVINFRIGNMDKVVEYGQKAAQVPYDDGYALLAGMCANHVAGETDAANRIAGRFRRAFPSLTQKELFGLYDLGPEMRSSISEIYSTYDID